MIVDIRQTLLVGEHLVDVISGIEGRAIKWIGTLQHLVDSQLDIAGKDDFLLDLTHLFTKVTTLQVDDTSNQLSECLKGRGLFKRDHRTLPFLCLVLCIKSDK